MKVGDVKISNLIMEFSVFDYLQNAKILFFNQDLNVNLQVIKIIDGTLVFYMYIYKYIPVQIIFFSPDFFFNL